jgi:MFS family permease
MLNIDILAGLRIVLGGSAVFYVLSACCYMFVTIEKKISSDERRWVNPFKLPSRRNIFLLTGLFSVDSFGGALILPSLAAYWFATRFGIELRSLAVVFFFSRVLVAISMWISAKLANRIGLINTMVFTHIPANLFVIGVVLAPVPWLAVLFWQLRSFLSSMDVPARESYTMAVVAPEERVAMGSTHYIGRSIASSLGPTTATALWNAFSAAVPFIGGAVIKIGYDLGLYFMFRKVRPPEEQNQGAPS